MKHWIFAKSGKNQYSLPLGAMSEIKADKTKTYLLIFTFVLVFLWAGWLLSVLQRIPNYKIQNLGLLGDSFGLINALFSGLALIGVVWSLIIQRKDFQQQLREFKESKQVQKNAVKVQILTAQINAESSILDGWNSQFAAGKNAVRREGQVSLKRKINSKENEIESLTNELIGLKEIF